MDFIELAYKRLDDQIKVHDYIDWAEHLLNGGSDVSSIAQLATCAWDAEPDAKQVERLFQTSIVELGLTLPADWQSALMGYASSLSRQMLLGTLVPCDLERKMLTLADDNNDPYILWIWIDLSRDLYDGHVSGREDIQFNGALDLSDSDHCIRRTAEQFVVLCSMTLEEQFPLIWLCHACGAVRNETTFIDTKTIMCPQCCRDGSMKNMRFFEHREEFVTR